MSVANSKGYANLTHEQIEYDKNLFLLQNFRILESNVSLGCLSVFVYSTVCYYFLFELLL